MSSDVESRLEGLLATGPEPDAGAGEEALHRALRALQPAPPAHRGLRTAVLAFAAALVLLAIAAGSLAAAGALHVSFGAKKMSHPPVRQLTLPRGADGIAAVVDGRLSVVIKGGFRLQVPATAAALSPHALYVAAGIGHSLVAMAPNGRKAWSHQTRGRVVSIAWAPDGLQIAYVVRSGRRLALHLIYGNGEKDMTIDRSVRAVRPSWRADSIALAYVGAGGRAVVYDLGHTRHFVASRASGVTSLAFSPRGGVLGVGTRSKIWLVGRGRRTAMPGSAAGFGWLGPDVLAISDGFSVAPARVGAPPAHRAFIFGGPVAALATGDQRFIAVVTGSSPRIVAGTTEKTRTVLRLPRGAHVDEIAIG